MLRGIKPLAHFLTVAGDEPECLVRYWSLFDRHVSDGRLIKREFLAPAPALPHRESRSLFYVLPGEEWRIEAMRALLAEPGEWTRDRERGQGELLGYEDWENDVWLDQWKRPARL